ncbi:MAG: tudor domain-containing protein [Tenuifilaceae bacterium]
MENNNNLHRANELYNQVVESFSYKTTDLKTGENRSYPVSYSEIKNARKKIKEIESSNISDPNFNAKLRELKSLCNHSLRKKFKPALPMLISILIWLAMHSYLALNNVAAKLEGYYNAEKADSIYTADLKMHQKQIDYYKTRPSDEDSPKWIKKHSEKLEALHKITPQQYTEQVNEKVRSEKIKRIIGAAFALIMLLLYLLAARTPMFHIYNARKWREWAREQNHSPGFITSTINAFMSVEPEKGGEFEVEIKMDDGTIRKERRTGDTVDLRPMFIGLFLALTFYVLLVLLPFIIIYKYLQNYQYEFFDRIKSAFTKNKKDAENEIIVKENKKKRNLPQIPDLKVGDKIFARFSADKYFYYASIETLNSQGAKVCYYDGTKEEVLNKDICTVGYAVQNLNAEANWQNKGLYYSCKITKKNDLSISVKYEDGTSEEVILEQFRFS